MADNSVYDFLSFINRQIEVQEKIENCTWQLEALIIIATKIEGFYHTNENTLHGYFSTVRDFAEKIASANQESLDELRKKKP